MSSLGQLKSLCRQVRRDCLSHFFTIPFNLGHHDQGNVKMECDKVLPPRGVPTKQEAKEQKKNETRQQKTRDPDLSKLPRSQDGEHQRYKVIDQRGDEDIGISAI